MSEPDEIYEVEKIVDKRLDNDVEEYLLRWKGYTAKDDWWLKEDDCLDCYDLIISYESKKFLSLLKYEPQLHGMKIYRNNIKLLVKWKKLSKEYQYFYSLAIQMVYPKILIEFYEKLNLDDEDNSSQYFRDNLFPHENVQRRDCDAEKIIAVANSLNRKMYLVAWRNEDEVSVIDESSVKSRFPHLLIQFYENNLFLRRNSSQNFQ